MKVRNGFVSNSSSSSFLIYGYAIDNNQARDIIEEYIKYEPDKMKEVFGEFNKDNLNTTDEMISTIDNIGIGTLTRILEEEGIFPFITFFDNWSDEDVIFIGKTLGRGDSELYVSYPNLMEGIKNTEKEIMEGLSKVDLMEKEVGLKDIGLHVYSYYDG